MLRRTHRILAFLAFLLGATLPSVSAAQSLSADPALYRGWEISGFEIEMEDVGLESDLKKGLAMTGQGMLFWKEHPLFSPEAFNGDLERTKLFLARHGYPSAEIRPRFDPRTKDREVKVLFDIELGPAVRLSETRTEAFPPELEERAAKILEIEKGERLTDRRVEGRMRELLRILQEGGYARARIRVEIERPAPEEARVLYVVRAGPVYRFARTIVRGASEDLSEVVRRSVDVEEGSIYSPEPLERAEENLRTLDLFRRVQIHTEEVDGDRLNVIAELAERPPQSVDAGVGYWTVDQARVSATWKHRNLLRAGRGLALEGSYSQFLQTAQARVWKPVLFHSRTRGSVALRGQRESEETYRLLAGEIEVAATYLHSLKTTMRPSITLSVFDLEARTDSAGAFDDPGPNLISFGFSWTRNDLNDQLQPTSGTFVLLGTESGLPGFETTRNYTLLEPEATAYVPLIGGLVFASHLRFGYALPPNRANELLPNKRFYAGGTTSMRGYERRMLGPLDANGKPIGGIAEIEGAVEIRFPIYWRFGGAAFCDVGQVWADRTAIQPFDLEVAVGPGLMLRTPIGPIRADVGFPVTPVPDGFPETLFHLSVGQVF
ncbi:MAG: BamA/TamA family outer membrane protein [Candidatus Eisenbacteria bacterium]|nr:BamA/TamA family outer membrane protein [Candidatus Latescibacterota bacterium]MBD3303024.1 BamA/TamA family outer membrane protein [Candidatus Eisenbacteria bacterium]